MTSTMPATPLPLTADAQSIVHACVALTGLVLVMLVLLYVTRLPAMSQRNIKPQDCADPAFLKTALPLHIRNFADNYNHLHEAPTTFYAIAFAIVLLGHSDALHAKCAWAYFYLRVLHSIVQVTANIVTIRFTLFAASWGALGIMIVREVLAIMSAGKA